jgi:hypothetical protein
VSAASSNLRDAPQSVVPGGDSFAVVGSPGPDANARRSEGRARAGGKSDLNLQFTSSSRPSASLCVMSTRLLTAIGAGIALAAVVVASASAGFVPAWSYVSPVTRAKLAAAGGGTLYLPARVPLFYRYRSGARVANGRVTVPFTNRVRVRPGVWRWTNESFDWSVQRLGTGKSCTGWAMPTRSFQLSGNKVYWSSGLDGGTAWRCATTARNQTYVMSAAGAKLSDVGLAGVVASGLDVARRSNRPTVALVVKPSTLHRGGSVLITGVAGGCTAGDTVTILSRAFAATHMFAGVPAALGQVGSAGRFSARTFVPRTRIPGKYQVTARCGGGNLGTSAWLTVAR